MRMPGDELDFLKRRKSTNCDLKVMTIKKADAEGDITDMVTGFYRKTGVFYDSIRSGVDGAIVKISRRLKEPFDREARSLQQCVCDAVCDAAEGTRGLFANLPVAIDKRLRIIISRAAGTSEATKLEASSSHNLEISRGLITDRGKRRPGV